MVLLSQQSIFHHNGYDCTAQNACTICAIVLVRLQKVRLYSILMEDIHELKEFGVKHCRVACFSGGGQYFSFSNNAQVGPSWT